MKSPAAPRKHQHGLSRRAHATTLRHATFPRPDLQKRGSIYPHRPSDRYEVEFKTTTGDPKGEGTQQVFQKKEFCRLLKGMALVVPVKKDGAKD